MRYGLSLMILFTFPLYINAQSGNETIPTWTEEDRQYLLTNLTTSKLALEKELQDLSKDQWNFKSNSDEWSINQIVEHLAIYELIFMNGITTALQMGEFPKVKQYPPDSLFLGDSPRPNETTDFTKPFSYTVPLGNNEGKNNLIWLSTMREESIEFVKREDRNLRVYYVNFGPNIHQTCMQIFSHTNRHLKQIKRIKTHPEFP